MTTIYNTSEFLGTIAGRQSYVPFNGGQTYARVLDEKVLYFDCVRDLRKQIAPMNESPEKQKQLGNEYSLGGEILSSMPGGGYFKTIETSNEVSRKYLGNHRYALGKIGEPLERLANIPMREIQLDCARCGIQYWVNRFFDGVEQPEEGNLVVYYDTAGNAVHSGIFRNSERNWNSPRGGTVESKWSSESAITANPFVFQHDFFFLPKECGTIAKFYRIKKTVEPQKPLPRHDASSGPMHTKMDDGTFRYVSNETNEKIRTTIDNTTRRELSSALPQIEYIEDKEFFGSCYMYALDKILSGNYKADQCDLLGCDKSEQLEKYFTPTSQPQSGDLAVYSDSNGSRVHFGIYVDEDLIESKRGSGAIYRHPPFYVAHSYGNTITYYRPK